MSPKGKHIIKIKNIFKSKTHAPANRVKKNIAPTRPTGQKKNRVNQGMSSALQRFLKENPRKPINDPKTKK